MLSDIWMDVLFFHCEFTLTFLIDDDLQIPEMYIQETRFVFTL